MEDKTGRLWWNAKDFYCPDNDSPYAVILLNEALDTSTLNFFIHIWKKAAVRVCVDGATNCYNNLTSPPTLADVDFCLSGSQVTPDPGSQFSASQLKAGPSDLPQEPMELPLPNIISGDFDSVRPELLAHYTKKGVNVISTPDQNETDFTKAVRELGQYINKQSIQLKHVLVLAAVNNNRFDHVFANLSTLYKVNALLPVPLAIVSGPSLSWLLSEGDHIIKVSQDIVLNKQRSWCGLVPLGHPAAVTTTGLKWNLDNQVLGFGHVISTSNTYDPTHDGEVKISTCHPILWTMGWDIEQYSPRTQA